MKKTENTQKTSKSWIQHLVIVLKGMWIGGTMTVPGVSGGSMAILLGIYDKLIFAISKFTKNIKANILFLVEFVLGAGVGLVLFSRFIMMLLERFEMPTSYFFLGAVAGGIPLIIKEAKITKNDFISKKTGKFGAYTAGKVLLYLVYAGIGILIVYLMSLLPEGLFSSHEGGIGNFLIKILGGAIVALALVLPGISVSQMLLMLGLYKEVFGSIESFDILPLIPLGIGLVAGIILSTLAIGKAIEKYAQATYVIIFGFVLGSLPELFPGWPSGGEIAACIATAILGFAVIILIMKGSDKAEAVSAKAQSQPSEE